MADEKKKLLLEDAHVMLHPIRFRLVELLAKRQMNISRIAKTMNVERRLVTYHLETLEEYGFVESKYEISEVPPSKGKAIRNFRLTDKVQETVDALKISL